MPHIDSPNFADACDLVLCPWHDRDCKPRTNPEATTPPSRVFLSGENWYFERCLHYLKNFENKIELVYHRTDKPFDRAKFEAVRPYCAHIWAENCEIDHPMITRVPLGFHPFHPVPKRLDCHKDILCYVNLGLYNDREVQFINCRTLRMHCIDHFKKQPWATVDEEPIPNDEFVAKMARARFVVCPPGFGLDTHRFYETSWLGGTPIVLSTGLNDMYRQFGDPMIVDTWEDVTKEKLETRAYVKPRDELFTVEHWLLQ